jgi:phage shock protein B
MDFDITAVLVIPTIVIGLPWLILHYITKWKTAPTLTNDDETLLDDLYQLARRLEDRMETVERLVAADNPDFRQARQLTDGSSKASSLDDLSAAPTKLRSGR